MAPKNRHNKCQICDLNESKQTCSGCATVYCSVPCYKKHKGTRTSTTQHQPSQHIPEESTYPDPLKWDEPNPLLDPSIQCHRFTPLLLPSPLILVTSSVSPVCNPAIRTTLTIHPNLLALLFSIDKLCYKNNPYSAVPTQ
ncbi:hypothetical protein K438DRAFT_1645645 [Mycena galopus ATCC 62051]|nr:hypothetical protein K438DRAFT_1645645 [Mycena galopus ATCC 62051]